MIARKYLIPLLKEFLEIRNLGRFYSSESLAVIVAKNNFAYSRFAFIVGKKVFNLSVTRHRVKRLLAEAVRNLKLPNNDYVFLAKKDSGRATLARMTDEINNLVPH